MLYPPKKRAFSPPSKKTKDLSNLMNINSKFTGSGGSTFRSNYRFFLACSEKATVGSQTRDLKDIPRRKVSFFLIKKIHFWANSIQDVLWQRWSSSGCEFPGSFKETYLENVARASWLSLAFTHLLRRFERSRRTLQILGCSRLRWADWKKSQ